MASGIILELVSEGDNVIETPYEVGRVSMFIRDSILVFAGCQTEEQYLSQEKKPKVETVLLSNISTEMLKKVLVWCDHHKNESDVVYEDAYNKRTDDIPEWDQKFFNVDKKTLIDYILAAKYLQVEGMAVIGYKTLANLIKGKTTEQLRIEFDIKNDLHPNQEDVIVIENTVLKEYQ